MFLEHWKFSRSVLSDSLRPHGLLPTRILRPWDSPSKSTGVGCHFLLQRIFPTRGSNPGLPHCRQTLYRLSHHGSPRTLRSIINWIPGYDICLAKNETKFQKYIIFKYYWEAWINSIKSLNEKMLTASPYNLYCCSVAKMCLTLQDHTDCRTPGFPVPMIYYLLHHWRNWWRFVCWNTLL